MRTTTIGLVLGFLVATAGLSASRAASAEDEFDVTVASGSVKLVAKGEWHINKEYPWKLVMGDTKLTKEKFSIDEKTATLTGLSKGHATLKGGVCSAGACKIIEKEIDVP